MSSNKRLLIAFVFITTLFTFQFNSHAQNTEEKIPQDYQTDEYKAAFKHMKIGLNMYNKGKNDSAIIILEEVLETASEINNIILEVQCLYNLGYVYYELAMFPKALELLHKSYTLSKEVAPNLQIGRRAINLGITYKKQGLYYKANEYFYEAIEIFDKERHKKEIASCYNSLGGIQARLENYKEALTYHHKSLELRKEIKYDKGIAGSYNNLALTYKKMDSLDKALEFYNASLVIKRKLGDKRSILLSLCNLADLYIIKGNTRKAMDYYNKALKLTQETNDKLGYLITICALGKSNLSEGKYELAETQLMEALKLSKEIGSIEREHEVLLHLKNLYFDKGDYEKSLEYFDAYTIAKDSVYNIEKTKAIANLHLKYETDKKDEEIANLNMIQEMQSKLIESKSNTVTILYISASIFLVLLTIIFIAYKQKRRVNMEIRTLMKEKQHRTKNNLQTIASVLSLQSLESDNEEIKEAVKAGKNRVQSIVLIENMLNQNSASTTIAMDNYLEKLSNNLITAYDYKDKIQLDRSIDPITLETEIATPVGLIVNELITNTFKYAFPGHTNPILSLKLTQDTNNNRITLIVADNGPGLPANSSNSMGLKLVRMLCKQLKAELHIQNESGLRYRIEIGM